MFHVSSSHTFFSIQFLTLHTLFSVKYATLHTALSQKKFATFHTLFQKKKLLPQFSHPKKLYFSRNEMCHNNNNSNKNKAFLDLSAAPQKKRHEFLYPTGNRLPEGEQCDQLEKEPLNSQNALKCACLECQIFSCIFGCFRRGTKINLPKINKKSRK